MLVAASTAMFYALNLTLMTTAIWWVRVDNLWVLGDTIMQMCRFPVNIYSRQMQLTLTYILPLAFIATIPTRQLVVGLDLPMVGLGLLWAAAALVISRLFWLYAMRQYSSASS
jgi:ABC-2 type transport system permease protein